LHGLSGRTVFKSNHISVPERFIEVFGVEVVNTIDLFSVLGQVFVKKVGQDADAVNSSDMGLPIDVKRPDFQEGFDMLYKTPRKLDR